MITYKDILEKATDHLFGEGKKVNYETPTLIISIVGGRQGLYGDFNEDFEIAIIDRKTGEFISEVFYPDLTDVSGQIMPYVGRDRMLSIVNELMKGSGS